MRRRNENVEAAVSTWYWRNTHQPMNPLSTFRQACRSFKHIRAGWVPLSTLVSLTAWIPSRCFAASVPFGHLASMFMSPATYASLPSTNPLAVLSANAINSPCFAASFLKDLQWNTSTCLILPSTLNWPTNALNPLTRAGKMTGRTNGDNREATDDGNEAPRRISQAHACWLLRAGCSGFNAAYSRVKRMIKTWLFWKRIQPCTLVATAEWFTDHRPS